MTIQAPSVENRKLEELFREFVKRVPLYLPEWNPDRANDAGTALARIFFDMFDKVRMRLNRMPEKSLVAFLDSLGFDLMPAQAARAWVVFTAISEAPTNALVLTGCELSGKGRDASGKEKEAPFQTLQDVAVSPAVLKELVSVRTADDEIYSFTFNAKTAGIIQPFSGIDKQEHCLYIAHPDLFNISQKASFIVDFLLSSGVQKDIVNEEKTDWFIWEYFNENYGGWIELGDVTTDGTNKLVNSGRMTVGKVYSGEIPETNVNNVKSRWIRCRSLQKLTAAQPKSLPEITSLKVSVQSEKLEPEMAFNNNVPIDVGIKSIRLMGIDVGEVWVRSFSSLESGKTCKAVTTSISQNPFKTNDKLQFDNGSEWKVEKIVNETPDVVLDLVPVNSFDQNGDDLTGSAIRLLTAIRAKDPVDLPVFPFVDKNAPNPPISFSIDDKTDLPESRFIYFTKPDTEQGQQSERAEPVSYKFKVISVKSDKKRADIVLTDEQGTPVKYAVDKSEGDSVYLVPHIKPFGEAPFTGDIFYLACDEAFSKKKAEITLSFSFALYGVPEDAKYSILPSVIWEYWNGDTKTWRRLMVVDTTRCFTNVTVSEKKNPEPERSNWNIGEVRFTCPDDIAKVKVNGEEKYWIRAKIIEGDYGKPVGLINNPIQVVVDSAVKKETINIVTSKLLTIHYPLINTISITYVSAPEFPRYCFCLNNADFSDVTDQVTEGNTPFLPFEEFPDKQDTLFFGFDKPLTSGPLRLYFQLKKEFYDLQIAESEWSYWKGNTWEKLTVDDTTGGFRMNGCVEFFGKRDFSQTSLFDLTRYWLRVSIIGGTFPDGLAFDGIFFNAVQTIQSSLISEEKIGASNGSANQNFTTINSPIIDLDIWVREPSKPDDVALQKIVENEPDSSCIEVTDNGPWKGEFWIHWHCVEDFDTTESDDRHYRVDRRTGTIYFGDGNQGMIPPKSSANIKISYRFGGGIVGNVEAGAITSVKTSIPYVKGVINPFKADGGAEAENQDKALERSSQCLQHRFRAVTVEDFERIALLSRAVARAHCVPNIDAEGDVNPGWISMLIIPKTTVRPPEASLQLISNVKKSLEEASVGTIAVDKRLSVRSPKFITIRVEATLVPKNADYAASIVANATRALDDFFDPITGGQNKTGGEFGGTVCFSSVIALLENVNNVDYTLECRLFADGVLYTKDLLLPFDAVTVSGAHSIDLNERADATSSKKLVKSGCALSGE